jgi:hypothetical protein
VIALDGDEGGLLRSWIVSYDVDDDILKIVLYQVVLYAMLD